MLNLLAAHMLEILQGEVCACHAIPLHDFLSSAEQHLVISEHFSWF